MSIAGVGAEEDTCGRVSIAGVGAEEDACGRVSTAGVGTEDGCEEVLIVEVAAE